MVIFSDLNDSTLFSRVVKIGLEDRRYTTHHLLPTRSYLQRLFACAVKPFQRRLYQTLPGLIQLSKANPAVVKIVKARSSRLFINPSSLWPCPREPLFKTQVPAQQLYLRPQRKRLSLICRTRTVRYSQPNPEYAVFKLEAINKAGVPQRLTREINKQHR
jgi:hypothetical protein